MHAPPVYYQDHNRGFEDEQAATALKNPCKIELIANLLFQIQHNFAFNFRWYIFCLIVVAGNTSCFFHQLSAMPLVRRHRGITFTHKDRKLKIQFSIFNS